MLKDLTKFQKSGLWLAVITKNKAIKVAASAKDPQKALEKAREKGFTKASFMKSPLGMLRGLQLCMKYSYTRGEDKFLPGGFGFLPLLDINLGPNKLPVRCLIDSGSPLTIIHSPLVVTAGKIPVDGKQSNLLEVGSGKLNGYNLTGIKHPWTFV